MSEHEAYEDFVKDTNASIEEKSKDIVNKSDMKAKAEGELVQATEEKESVMLELEQLSNYNAQLHQSCDSAAQQKMLKCMLLILISAFCVQRTPRVIFFTRASS